MTIEVFQNLDISFPELETESFINDLTNILAEGWTRDIELENKVNNDANVYNTQYYCFKCDETEDRKAATLWLIKSTGGLKVNNITPAISGRLSYSEYNAILNEFHKEYILPICNKKNFETRLSKANITIDDWAEPATVKALKLFSVCANKGTGRGHPLDDERWMDFVLTAHEVNDSLHSEDLRRWLVEEEKWFDEIAWKLCEDYEYGRQLLKKYEQS
ncbi:MAG: hypothetical protein WAW86_07635 [Gammaproteobacteria bacterium]